MGGLGLGLCLHQNLLHRAIVREMRALKPFANCLVLCKCALLLLLTALLTTMMKELSLGWESNNFAWCCAWRQIIIPRNDLHSFFTPLPQKETF